MIPTMDKSEEYKTLAPFTALAPLAVGGLLGLLVAPVAKPIAGIDMAAMVVLATGILALIASLFHLGRPWRAPLALLHIAGSWLSREVFLFGLFLVFLGVYAVLPVINSGGLLRTIIGVAGVIIGLLGTLATGKTYQLHSRPAWDQWPTVATFPLGALSTGLLFGFFVAQQFPGHMQVKSYAWIGAAFLLLASLSVTWLRSVRRHPDSTEGQPSRQLVLGPNLWLLVIRVAAGGLALAMIGFGGASQSLAWIPALLGEFADRVLFFKAVVPITLRGQYS